jgi:hypothetical protein
MFSLLNSRQGKGKSRAKMCNILNSLSQFFHALWRRFSESRYLIEGGRFRERNCAGVGLSIALLVRQPALLQIRSRKD